MPALAAATMFVGIFMMYDAWKSHKSGTVSAPLTHAKAAL